MNLFSGLQATAGEITPVAGYQSSADSPYHAFDKDLSTSSWTNLDGPSWLRLEFNRTYFIHKVIIYQMFYNDWYDSTAPCVASKGSYKACKDGTNNVTVSVVAAAGTETLCGSLQMTYGLEQESQVYTIVCRVQGNALLLSSTSGNITISEIVVTSAGRYTARLFLIILLFNI